jgi:hypothetical protein
MLSFQEWMPATTRLEANARKGYYCSHCKRAGSHKSEDCRVQLRNNSTNTTPAGAVANLIAHTPARRNILNNSNDYDVVEAYAAYAHYVENPSQFSNREHLANAVISYNNDNDQVHNVPTNIATVSSTESIRRSSSNTSSYDDQK